MIMSTGTVRFHRVLDRAARARLPRLPRRRRHGQVAAAERLHRPGPPDGRQGRRQLPHVVHEFLLRQEPRLRRHISRAGAARTLRYTDKFDDPNLPGEMQTTIILKKVSVGTEIDIVQEGIPA